MRNQFKFTEPFDPTVVRHGGARRARRQGRSRQRAAARLRRRRQPPPRRPRRDRRRIARPKSCPSPCRSPTGCRPRPRVPQRYLDFVERAAAVNREFNQRVLALLTVDAPRWSTPSPVQPMSESPGGRRRHRGDARRPPPRRPPEEGRRQEDRRQEDRRQEDRGQEDGRQEGRRQVERRVELTRLPPADFLPPTSGRDDAGGIIVT